MGSYYGIIKRKKIMAKQIDPIKKKKYKRARLENKSIAKSLLEAGYSRTSAYNRNSQLSCVKVGDEEILRELEENDITVKLVVNNLNEDRELARKKNDIATMKEVDRTFAQYKAMLTEKRIIEQHYIEPTERERKLNRLRTLIIKPIQPVVVSTENNEP